MHTPFVEFTFYGRKYKCDLRKKRWQGFVSAAVILLLGMITHYCMLIYVGSEYDCDDWRPKVWMMLSGGFGIFVISVEVLAVFQSIDLDKTAFFPTIQVIGAAGTVLGTAWLFDDSITSPCSHSLVTYGRVWVATLWILTLVHFIGWCISKCMQFDVERIAPVENLQRTMSSA